MQVQAIGLPSVPSGTHSASSPASSPLKPAFVADVDPHVNTTVQSQSSAAAADIDSSVVNQQQQQVSEQRHNSSDTAGEEAAQPPGGSTAVTGSDQRSDRSQHMQHGIPGFGAMSPAQQSAAMLAKWGVTPSPELQMQLQVQAHEQQLQLQQPPQTDHPQLQAIPSHSDAAQRDGLTTIASAADVPEGLTTNPDQTLPAGLGGASASGSSLHDTLTDVGQRDRIASIQVHKDSQPADNTTSPVHQQSACVDASQSWQQSEGDAQGSSALVSGHRGVHEEGLALEQPDGSNGKQLPGGAEEAGVLMSERSGVVEGGLGLEQPDGEGTNPLWTPEVVRGRVVRATEMWHRQRIQQEASQQVTSS